MKTHLCMMMTAVAAVLTLLLAGCSSVTTSLPVSADPKPLDQELFEGAWIIDKGAVAVHFASNGVGRLAGLEWKDDRFRMLQGEMIVAKGKQNNFMSVRFEEDGVWTNAYSLLQYRFTDQGDLLLWSPNVKTFEAAVATNTLLGVITTGQYSTNVHVTNSPAALIDFIEKSNALDLFQYREPTVLRKITPPDKPAKKE